MTRLKSIPIGFIVLGAVIGISVGVAFGQTVYCSHAYPGCQGTIYNDDIYGWENNNEIGGRNGRDLIMGYGAYDELYGDYDGDNLNGGEGVDYVYGEPGNDSYFVIGGGAGVYGQSQNDMVAGGVGNDYVEGDNQNDWIYGNDHDDVLYAEDSAADTVDGNSGANVCYVDGYDAFSNCTPY